MFVFVVGLLVALAFTWILIPPTWEAVVFIPVNHLLRFLDYLRLEAAASPVATIIVVFGCVALVVCWLIDR